MNERNRQLFGHLGLALARYSKEARRDGLAVPDELLNLAEFFTDCARTRQDAPTFAGSGQVAESEDMTQRLMLSKRETASLLGVSARTVDRLIASGALLAVKLEGATKVRRSDLEAYVAGLSGARSFRDTITDKDAS